MVPEARPRPAPTQKGGLAKTPLAHLLVYANDRQLTGTFELCVGDARSTIVLSQGRPTKARVHLPVPYLGRVLLERGHINEQQLDTTLLDLAKTRRLHGRILMERGYITPQHLRDGLREQLYRKLDALFDLPPETTFEYFASYDALADYGGPEEVTADPFVVVKRGITRQPSWDHVAATLAHMGTARIRIAKTAALERFELGKEELQLVEIVRAKPMSLHDMLGAELLPPKRTQLLVYTLAITKQIGLIASDERPDDSTGNFSPVEVVPPPSSSSVRTAPPTGAGQQPPQGTQVGKVSLRKTLSNPGVVEEMASSTGKHDVRSSDVPPSPRGTLPRPEASTPKHGIPKIEPSSPRHEIPKPEASDPAISKRRKEIIDRAQTIDKQNYFEMLDVPHDASTDVIRNAYFQLARTWHPDRLPPQLAEVKPACAKVFARLSEAHQTLSDDAKRAQYIQQLGKGASSADEERAVQAVLEATLCFQKAEICFKRNDYLQTETLVRRALELDATQADYHALLAWVVAMKDTSPEATAKRVQELDQAVLLNPRCERAYFYRAQLHKRAGNDALALRDFKSAYEINPRNLDAQREVRLLEMRKGQKKEEEKPGGGGLFSRLFGKK